MSLDVIALGPVVSTRIGFGGSRLHYLKTSTERQRLLAAAFDAGIRHFDAAPVYGHGLAEREIGSFVRGRPDCVIVTKYGIQASTWIGGLSDTIYRPVISARSALNRLGGGGALTITPKSLRKGVEGSLLRMKREMIDIHLLHEPELARIPDLGAIVATYQALISEGKIRAAGVSGNFQTAKRILENAPDSFLMQTGESEWDESHVPDLTYGAISRQSQFRGQKAVTGFDAQRRIAEALARRPNGVVLMSTTRPENITTVVG